jgi:hypothetical protein
MDSISKERLLNEGIREEEIPYNVGTRHNLPEEIRAMIGSNASSVIAWTTVDEEEWDIERATCCMTFGPFLFLPCFWPHLIVCCPFFCFKKWLSSMDIRNTYWILTEHDVKIFCCGFGDACCYTSGDSLVSIPLLQITDCGIQTPSQGCCGECVSALSTIPTIYIDTPSTPREGKHHEAVGHGLAGYEWFLSAILQQREWQRRQMVTSRVMERGDSETVERRIQKITNLLESGIMTKEEYNKKRQEIFASI